MGDERRRRRSVTGAPTLLSSLLSGVDTTSRNFLSCHGHFYATRGVSSSATWPGISNNGKARYV